METSDPAPVAGRESADANISAPPTEPAPPAPPSVAGTDRARTWTIALSFGLAAGAVAWLIGEFALNAFEPQKFKVVILTQTFVQATTPSTNTSEFKNATLAFAIFGAVVGLAMGLAGGIASRSMIRGVATGLGGVAAGAAAGAGASLLLLRFYYRAHIPDPNDILSPILVHGGIWTAIGAVGGLAFGVAIGAGRRLPQAIEGACIGAFFATVVYHLVSGFFFPDSGFAQPIGRDSINRLLSRLLVAVLLAAGAARGAQSRAERGKKPTPLALGD